MGNFAVLAKRILYAFLLIILSLAVVFSLLLLLFPYLTRYLYRFEHRKDAAQRGENLINKYKAVAAIGAHPDDIEWWAAGSLLRAKRSGAKTIVIIATDNLKNGILRRKEQLEAARIMGYDKVYFLGYTDGDLKNAKMKKLISDIKKILIDEDAEAVITFDTEKPSVIYRHPDHLAAGKAAEKAAKEAGIKHLYLFHTKEPDTVVDVSSVLEKKLSAYAAHKSQQGGLLFQKIFLVLTGSNLTPATMQLKRQLKIFGEAYGLNYAEIFRYKNLD